MNLAVIPARGGSKRIRRKNILPFAGKPMLAHAIEGARRSGLFGRIVVSTDDAEIAAIARAWGAEVPFLRPAELADDHAGTAEVIAHAVTTLAQAGASFDAVCCIYPAVPLLRSEDLAAALAMLAPGCAEYVFPVAAYPAAIQRALRRRDDGRTVPFHPEYSQCRSQDLEPAFHDAGQFYWAAPGTWARCLPVHANARTLVLPAWRVVDIDTPDDWVRAEALYRALGGATASDPASDPASADLPPAGLVAAQIAAQTTAGAATRARSRLPA